MITTSLLTIRNIIIIWNIYHYFLYAHTIYKGFYYTEKVIKLSKNTFEYLLIDTKKNDKLDKNEGKEKEEWVIL